MNALSLALCFVLFSTQQRGGDDSFTKGLNAYREKVKALLESKRLTDLETRTHAEVFLQSQKVERLSLDQIALIAGMPFTDASLKRLDKRLSSLAEAASVEGAKASSLRLRLAKGLSPEDQRKIVRQVLTHPGLHAYLKTPEAVWIFQSLRSVDNSVLRAERALVLDLTPIIARDVDVRAFTVAEHYDLIKEITEERNAREAARLAVIAFLERAMREEAMPDRRRQYLGQKLQYLNGPAATDSLLNSTAPDLRINWSSDPSIQSLDRLKGKIVILDFWATWCGPCVASFPELASIQRRYKDSDVVVLGVTSLQGKHIMPNSKSIDTKGDPQKEYKLMLDYIQQKQITWPIVFSKDWVFNPSYGVQGIPHVAIIDTRGLVRYNGLRIEKDLSELTLKIDALLREAGKTPPASLK